MLVVCGCLLIGFFGLAGMAAATERLSFTTRQMLHDPSTGLAIYGIDPLSYFIEGTPLPGDAEIESIAFGLIWRFASKSNRAAFDDSPSIYSPRFGGYDAFQLLNGFLAEGNPAIFIVDKDQLILFASALNRDSWLRSNSSKYPTARENWRALIKTLPR
jgi:hypothetical protein